MLQFRYLLLCSSQTTGLVLKRSSSNVLQQVRKDVCEILQDPIEETCHARQVIATFNYERSYKEESMTTGVNLLSLLVRQSYGPLQIKRPPVNWALDVCTGRLLLTPAHDTCGPAFRRRLALTRGVPISAAQYSTVPTSSGGTLVPTCPFG